MRILRRKKRVSFRGQLLFFALFILVASPGFSHVLPATGQDTAESSLAPLNPEFLQYHQERVAPWGPLQFGGPDALGLIPSPIDRSHLRRQTILTRYQALGFPASYDLRTLGKVTPVRNQGSCGSCWSFATYGSLESDLLTSETWNFSENNLKNTHGFDLGHCEGGNADMSTAYLARWSGPVSETDDPYSASSSTSPPGLTARKHVQEVLIIPDRAGASDNDSIKQAVMSYGAIFTTMYWNSNYYNSGTYAYYYSGSNYANHAVAIVGWDDNFDKNKFPSIPAGDGAFIVRNSWGTSWGESGYFYMSYYDSRIGESNYVFNNGESTSNYIRIYQYDPLGHTANSGYGSNTAWFANVFNIVASESLEAVSFNTSSEGSSYEIYIYNNVTSGPTTGSLAASKSGTIPWVGYHTIFLDSDVPLTSGQKFSVVVLLTTPGCSYPIPMECPYSGYSSQATANAGESYISSNGTNWSDIASIYSNTNVCLKAFTGSLAETVSSPTTLSGQTSGIPGTGYTYSTGGSWSNLGHSIEYYFDWGDGTDSGWLTVGTTGASHSWTSAGTYLVKARARCATHTSVVSGWSGTLSVVISLDEAISTPATPTGSAYGDTGTSYTYTASGSSSNLGHSVQYYFDWGDGTDSGWLPVGTTSASKSWVNLGTYFVKAQARCATHPEVVSSYSEQLSVSIGEIVSTPVTPEGTSTGYPELDYIFTTGGSTTSKGDSVQYIFDWGDGTDSGWLPVGTVSASKSWTTTGVKAVKVKARCSVHNSVVSDWASTSVNISHPGTVTLFTPNGANVIPSGSAYTIHWGAPSSAVKFNLSYSLDNGTTWKTIGKNLPNRSCPWTVPTPAANKKKCFVKVAGFDSSGVKVGTDRSALPFAIEVIRLESPNGDVPLTAGSTGNTISWTTNGTKSDIAKVILYLTMNGGTTWSRIGTLYEDTGSYNAWTAPGVLTTKTKCKVKVVLKDADGVTLGSDVSDAYFTIGPAP